MMALHQDPWKDSHGRRGDSGGWKWSSSGMAAPRSCGISHPTTPYSFPEPRRSTSSLPGRPNEYTAPVRPLGKYASLLSNGAKKMFPDPTYTRPRDTDGPHHTGPSGISFNDFPVAVS